MPGMYAVKLPSSFKAPGMAAEIERTVRLCYLFFNISAILNVASRRVAVLVLGNAEVPRGS